MEREIGEIFEYEGEWYQCIVEKGCKNCAFNERKCYAFTDNNDPIGDCSAEGRTDKNSVIFKKLEKVGEPYMAHDHSRNKDVVVQDYKLYNQHACYTGHEEMLSFGLCGKVGMVTIKSKEPIKSLNCENSVEIKIKQNKEDMEEKNDIRPYNEYFSEGTVSNTKHLVTSNLKPFDLEAAKAGKPVRTRDGRKARIICFDRISGDDYYKIVACVTAFDGDFEAVLFYGIDGHIVDSQSPKEDDLMMLPEKKEGWVNVYRDCDGANITKDDNIYSSKDAAIASAKIIDRDNYVATTIIKWEE